MFGKLTNEEEQCIDDILTSGLNEINDVPSLALSSMSIQSMPCYGQNNDLNLSRNNKNKSLSNHSSKNTNSINDKLEGENINKSNLSVSLHLSSSINDKENITNSIKEEKENNNNFINQIMVKKVIAIISLKLKRYKIEIIIKIALDFLMKIY